MAKLRNISGEDLHVYYPSGHPESVLVEAGKVLDVVTTVEDVGDAYLVTAGKQPLTYPKAQWELVQSKTKNEKE